VSLKSRIYTPYASLSYILRVVVALLTVVQVRSEESEIVKDAVNIIRKAVGSCETGIKLKFLSCPVEEVFDLLLGSEVEEPIETVRFKPLLSLQLLVLYAPPAKELWSDDGSGGGRGKVSAPESMTGSSYGEYLG
jgi:hypothetical protein